jgi:hypothetical protein
MYAGRYYIPGVELTRDESVGIIEQERVDELTEVVKGWARFSEIKRGDTVCFIEDPYRNEGLFFWDGEKLLVPDDTDEYGNVPKELVVSDTEFHPCYWQDSVAHNGIFWLAPEILERMKFKMRTDGSVRARLHIGENSWTCIVDAPAESMKPPTNFKDWIFVAEGPCEFEGEYDPEKTFFVRERW